MNVEYSNKWVSVLSEGNGEDKYYYVHQKNKICILPYIYEEGDLKIVTLLEPISIWDSTRKKQLTCVQGTIDEGENPLETAPRELMEETGFDVPLEGNEERYDYLGYFNFSKGNDSHRHLFLCDVTGSKRKKKTTDGSEFEKKTKIMISDSEPLKLSTDLTLNYLYSKLKEKLNL